MKANDLAALLFLSALWGGSFLFIRVAAPELGPFWLMELRVLIAGVTLFAYTRLTHFKLGIRQHWKQYLVIGLLNSAIPFVLIATAELHLTSGFAAILNATTPLFGAFFSAIFLKEVVTGKKALGLSMGIIGVGILVGWNSGNLDWIIALSILASLAGAVFYGIASVYSKVASKGIQPLALSTCSQLAAALFILPTTPFTIPAAFPSLAAILSTLTLSILGTAIAYLIFFRLIKNVGPTRTLTVTFLSPVFGVTWGAIFLGETITPVTVIGFGIVLAGVGLVTGLKLPGRANPENAGGKIS